MNRSCFIITGTSKGIGEHLSRMLLERGHLVVGIARRSSEALLAYTSYTHISYDLSDAEGLEPLISSVIQQLDLENFGMAALINNASMLEPLKPIEQCSSEELTRSLHVSFLAPMILTSTFIRHSEHLSLQRKVMNISSGSGIYPAPGMSAYCSAKAGLNMFT
ncbi:SDR family NAD(P)-dependent oxidoreductase [Paenibacillus sp. 1001270B_150601_E10]|uniref:SDR family NAD(P)-dependent oxidoreductase n=1 Tax=Paenibacillus sp. 1001270B_150601_E10 TaxID=2787079 RepID=UPI001E605FBF|nr:SDR family NAD(P)-dependent oxidoreductase [Paenibacillus sp. 1001270B_150601_E10]